MLVRLHPLFSWRKMCCSIVIQSVCEMKSLKLFAKHGKRLTQIERRKDVQEHDEGTMIVLNWVMTQLIYKRLWKQQRKQVVLV